MSVKLKTFSLKDKKASDKQYDFNLEEDNQVEINLNGSLELCTNEVLNNSNGSIPLPISMAKPSVHLRL